MARLGKTVTLLLWVLVLMFAAARTRAGAAAPALGEYQIKAAYLLNFARFLEWPDSSSNRGPIIVGVLGADPFGEVLEAAFNGKTIRGRAFSVRRFRSVQEIDECHILFISSSETTRIAALVQHFSKTPVLTVSDSKDFIGTGGAIGFIMSDHRVVFDINLNAIASARLKASAQLIEVAHALQGSLK